MRSAVGKTIQLEHQHGIYMIAVRINETMILPFILDSGASEVVIPSDVFLTLLRSGTVRESDFLEPGTYVLADGSKQSSDRFILHEVRVGDHVVRNVIANVAPVRGDPLLGQSFLSKLPSWAIDNQRHVLVFNDLPASLGVQPLSPPQPAPSAPPPVSPVMSPPTSIGELVERGRRAQTERNYSDAMRLYQMAAAQGNATAENNIGVLYANGLGVPLNYAEAMRWYRLAADQGEPIAKYNIGALYEDGRGVSRDYVEAMRWYRIAADQGNVDGQNNIRAYAANGSSQNYTVWAQYRIGRLYLNGLGVARDYPEALRWFRLAATQGLGLAQNEIGALYLYGKGAPQNYGEAMRWFQMAAAQGDSNAQDNIGIMIAQGIGVKKDCVVARQWLERAAAAGSDQAGANLGNGVMGRVLGGSSPDDLQDRCRSAPLIFRYDAGHGDGDASVYRKPG
jgi:TPR repeat protein